MFPQWPACHFSRQSIYVNGIGQKVGSIVLNRRILILLEILSNYTSIPENSLFSFPPALHAYSLNFNPPCVLITKQPVQYPHFPHICPTLLIPATLLFMISDLSHAILSILHCISTDMKTLSQKDFFLK